MLIVNSLFSNLGDKRSGNTVGGTGITAQDQVANQQTGSADHLGMAFKK